MNAENIELRKKLIRNCHRIVVKAGTRLLTDPESLPVLIGQIKTIRDAGKQVILVSSGAVGIGMKILKLKKRPRRLSEVQALAALGQGKLMAMYEAECEKLGFRCAQILLTADDLRSRERHLNALNCIETLLSQDILPIINENDTVVTDEIKVGDNDTLASLVTNLIEADVLVILTDQKGLYSADPRKDPQAKFIAVATAGDPALEQMAGGAASSLSKGGMITKVLAAKRAARSGAATVIASGREENVLVRLCAGELIGTQLNATHAPLHARAMWLADQLRSQGSVLLDDGAAKALLDQKTSLLPVGIRAVIGEFVRGDVVSCLTAEGTELARGLVNYSSSELRQIQGRHTEELGAILGYAPLPEAIHRDNLVMLVKKQLVGV